MVRQNTEEFEFSELTSDIGEFAGWDPYVIWLCNQYAAPVETPPADANDEPSP